MVIIEMIIIRFKLKESLPWKEIALNLNSGHVFMWVGRSLAVLVYGAILTHCSLGWVEQWPPALQWAIVFIGWDFCFYWSHRMHHDISFLWNVHVVHHQGEHFSLSLGIRNSWYSSLTSLPFFIPLAIIGAPLQEFIVVGSVHYFIQFYNHNHLIKRSGWLESFMVTPTHHILHHARNPEYRGKNCSGSFIIWDKLFGTFQEKLEDVPIQLGIDESIPSDNPFWINNLAFLKFFKVKTPDFTKSRFQFYNLPDFWIGFAGLLLFAWLIFYISVEKSWDNVRLSYLFLIIFISTISVYGLSKGKIWGVAGWVLFFCIGNLLFIYFYSAPALILLLLTLSVFHVFTVLALTWKQFKNSAS